jgi:serine/threonine protein kinase
VRAPAFSRPCGKHQSRRARFIALRCTAPRALAATSATATSAFACPQVYLVLESCEGGDLFKAMMKAGGRLPEATVAVEIIVPLLRVLESLNTLNLIHRDIKPENIFLMADGTMKLGDFGLAIDAAVEIPFCRSGAIARRRRRAAGYVLYQCCPSRATPHLQYALSCTHVRIARHAALDDEPLLHLCCTC